MLKYFDRGLDGLMCKEQLFFSCLVEFYKYFLYCLLIVMKLKDSIKYKYVLNIRIFKVDIGFEVGFFFYYLCGLGRDFCI